MFYTLLSRELNLSELWQRYVKTHCLKLTSGNFSAVTVKNLLFLAK